LQFQQMQKMQQQNQSGVPQGNPAPNPSETQNNGSDQPQQNQQ
jgi:hypothetical protein